MTRFFYDHDILRDFPQARGIIIHLHGAQTGTTSAELLALYQAEQASVKARLAETSLSELPSLSAWRGAFRAFGVDPTQYRSAAEALLRRLTKKGDIPSINAFVDIGNWVSIRYALPVAVLDLAGISGDLRVHRAQGDEPFIDLHATEAEYPEVGEVIFSDQARRTHARRWCFRQSAASAAQAHTRDALIVCEAQHPDSQSMLVQAQNDLLALLGRFVGGTMQTTSVGG